MNSIKKSGTEFRDYIKSLGPGLITGQVMMIPQVLPHIPRPEQDLVWQPYGLPGSHFL
jgi:hypothetical protein